MEERWKVGSETDKGPWWESWKRWRRQSEEEESPGQLRGWDTWIKWWKVRSEEEKSPDELKREWDAWKAWKVRSEEEKGKGRVLNLDEIPHEGETLDDIIESGEIPEELRESIQALAKAIQAVLAKAMQPVVEGWKAQQAEWAGGIIQSYRSELQRIRDSAGRISEGRFTLKDVDTLFRGQYDVVEGQGKIIGILQELLEAGKARERRILVLTVIGWGIAFISIAVQVITWWLGR